MNQHFETIQKFGKTGAEANAKSFDVITRGTQAIVLDTAEYAKKSFEQAGATFEKLFGARTLDKAIEIQAAHAKATVEGLIAQTTKTSESLTRLANDAFKPYEALAASFGPAVTAPKTVAK
jgi:hypothetical protein